MNFCVLCNNMLYLTISADVENELNYFCRNCGFTEQVQGIVSLSTTQNKCKHTARNIVNKYTKFDPTLPRVNNIDCVNETCITNKSHENEVQVDKAEKEIIFIRYDDSNMKYIYMCVHCDTVWGSENRYINNA